MCPDGSCVADDTVSGPGTPGRDAAPPLLSAHGIRYATSTGRRALCDLTLQVRAGELIDVRGPSGGGKTTLLLALARLLPGAQGQLHLMGESAETIAPVVWRSRVALLPQKVALTGESVRDAVTAPWRLKVRAAHAAPGDARIRESLDRVGLADIELDQAVTRLSVGQETRIAFVRTLLTAPSILLLDEAEASLDSESASRITEVALEFVAGGGGVVRVRHRGDDGNANRRFLMEAGRLEELS